ncbi:sensor domain-containing diguanylate cyclase [Arhodomonas sp. SL1]|uniref:sensor domain-containing diguanylate cyclase n=1 Tax=Arhodomonas sp. SL1 TaxID=3425691 RepID=UPI003F882571
MGKERRRQRRQEVPSSHAEWAPRRRRAIGLGVYVVVVLLALIGIGLTVLALEIQSGVRAYVTGESQWSKGQKEAVYQLERFASTGEVSDLKEAREALQVPLADRRARLAMERQPPDREAAIRHFIEGRNHPDDAPRMVWLFLYFRGAPYLRDAVTYWREADAHILRLAAMADAMEAHFEAGRLDPGTLDELREELSRIAKDVRPLQDGFSDALGEGSRWIGRWLKAAVAAAIAALALITSLVFHWATRRIADSEMRFRDTFEQAATGMAQIRPEGTLVAVNNAFCELLGYSPNDLVGRSLSEFLCADQDPGSLHRFLAGGGDRQKQEYQLISRNGANLWCKLSVSQVDTAWGGRQHLILGVENVTEARELMQVLHYQARHDALTGVVNRREFEEQLERGLRHAREHGTQHAVCFIDLDQFKVVNDRCGHLAGDEVLQEVARLLRGELRHTDVLARLGGDEFGVILWDCDEGAAIAVAEKLRHVVRGYVYSSEETTVRLGASIGCVAVDRSVFNVEDVLRAADAACYLAKEYGRDRVVPYSPGDHDLQGLSP